MGELEQAEASLTARRASPRGTVRVGVTTAFGLFLAEHLAPLLWANRGLKVALFVGDDLRNMADEGLDLALRVGTVEETGLIERHLGEVPRILVAAPAYLADHGVPVKAGDLLRHDCIGYGYGPAPVRWHIDGCDFAVAGQFRVNSSEALQRAAVAGLGIALLPLFHVASQISAGNLLAVMPASRIDPLSLSIVHRAQIRLPERSRAVLDYIVGCFDAAILKVPILAT
ncbi:hypothetical protein BH10PSE12_BH10PSE12_21860 [soil metagenome]